jgi:cell division protein FtsZ
LKEARVHFNAITVIPNERVFHVVNKDTPLKEALSTVNKFLSESLGGLIETIYEPGLINIDFADFRTVLEGKGRLAYLNAVKEDGAKNIVDTVLKSPFYPYTIRGAKGVLFNIIGEKNLSLSDVNQISKAISELVNPEAKIIFGISQQKNHSHSVRTVLLATGCDRSEEIRTVPEKKKKKKKKSVLVKNEKTEKPKVEKLKPKVVRKKKKKKPKEEPKKETKENEDTTRVSDESKDSSSRFADARVGEEKVRKNALQIKKETEEMEREMAEKEKFWETPAFLRRK